MKVIYGPKGSGKTKAIIDAANGVLPEVKGNVVFVTDTNRCRTDVNLKIRFLDTTEFGIQCEGGLIGFIKGLVAANTDNEYIFLDGIVRITGKPISELKKLFEAIEALEKGYGAKFTVTASAKKEDLPDFVLKYV